MSRVVVAGSIITDMSVQVQTHPKVGETVIGSNLKYSPGGKGANQAVSAARLGAETVMVGKIGNDTNGELSQYFMEDKESIDCYDVTRTDLSPTGVAMIVVSESSDNNIVVIPGANDFLSVSDIDAIFRDHNLPKKGDIFVAQFETPLESTKHFFERGKEFGTINILNPAPAREIPKDILKLVDILIVNETELEVISRTKVDVNDEKTIIEAIDNIGYFKTIIVTLGKNGAFAMDQNDKIFITKGIEVNAIDTTGAGDCFVGAIAAWYAINSGSVIDLKEAMLFANTAASLSVQKQGSGISMPYAKDIQRNLCATI
jgi:ribokinase